MSDLSILAVWETTWDTFDLSCPLNLIPSRIFELLNKLYLLAAPTSHIYFLIVQPGLLHFVMQIPWFFQQSLISGLLPWGFGLERLI